MEDNAVYILKSNEYYKIGFTNKISKRYSQINTSTPFKLEIVDYLVTNVPREIESTLHLLLKDKNIKGEWFKLDDFELGLVKLFFETYRKFYSRKLLLDELYQSVLEFISKFKVSHRDDGDIETLLGAFNKTVMKRKIKDKQFDYKEKKT